MKNCMENSNITTELSEKEFLNFIALVNNRHLDLNREMRLHFAFQIENKSDNEVEDSSKLQLTCFPK